MVLLLGLVLRLIGLDSRSLQYDDTFSIFLSARSLPEILSGTAADTMPPLYYFLLHYWMLLGQSAWFIRLLSVLLSLVAITLLYQLVACWFDRSAATWAAVLAAISPLLIYHGQDVRMYALLVVAQLGYLWFFTRIWFTEDERPPAWGNWAGLVLCGAAAMYSHNVAIFGLIVPDLFLLIQRRWKRLAHLIAAQLVIGLLALPWLLMIPGQVTLVPLYLMVVLVAWGWQDALPILTLSRSPLGGSVPAESEPFVHVARLLILGFVVFFAVMIRLAWSRNRYDERDGFEVVEDTPAGAPVVEDARQAGR